MLARAGLRTTDLSYSAGDTVFERGAPTQFVYVVNTGGLFRFRLLPGGRRSILQFLFAGDGFGYEPGGYHRDTVQAMTDSEVLAAGRQGLVAPSVQRRSVLFDAAARAFVLAEEQAVVIRGTTATERMALFLLEMDARISIDGQIDLPMGSKRYL
jgi:CRP-like cAMP-binding protein